jgi:hypothetical protein
MLQVRHEFLRRNCCLTQDSAQRALIHFTMHWNNADVTAASHYKVASFLSAPREAQAFKCFRYPRPGHAGKFRHVRVRRW